MEDRDLVHEQEALESKVRLDGKGEDPAVQALLSDEFVKAPDSEALEVSLALQQIIRGNSSILANLDKQATELQELKKRMDLADRRAELWEDDQKKFMEHANDIMDRTRKANPIGPEDRERFEAETARRMKEAVNKQRAKSVVIEETLRLEPQETLPWPSEIINVVNGRYTTPVQVPISIKIHHLEYGTKPPHNFQPGELVKVPQTIAQIIRDRQRSHQETQERRALIDASPGKTKEDRVIAPRWTGINEKYGSPGPEFPVW